MMKVLLITLLCVAAASARVVLEQDTLAEGPACPLPPLLEFEEGNINITLKELLIIDEDSIQRGGIALNLHTLYYKFTINYLLLTVKFEATIERSSVSGNSYDATGNFNLAPFSSDIFPSGNFVGTGLYDAEIVGLAAEGSATILVNLITNRISISRLSLTKVEFNSLSLDLGTFKTGEDGTLVDFTSWSANIKPNFDREFASVGDDFVQRVRKDVINPILAQYTLAEFLEIIGGGEGQTSAPCVTEPSVRA